MRISRVVSNGWNQSRCKITQIIIYVMAIFWTFYIYWIWNTFEGNALKGYCMMRRQTRPPDLEFRRWFPFVALSFYTWKAGIYWSRVKISKDHIWEHDMENLGKTHYFLKIIPAPMFSDMQWFVMIAKRVLWPLFTIEDSTANVKRVWRYLMRRNEIIRITVKNSYSMNNLWYGAASKYSGKKQKQAALLLVADRNFLLPSSWTNEFLKISSSGGC